MVKDYVEESGMRFSIAPVSHFFHIEESQTYKKIKQQGVKSAEFIYLRNYKNKEVINIIEARTSSPHPENEVDNEKFIEEISEKFNDSFLLYLASVSGRQEKYEAEIPSALMDIDLKNVDFSFVLVIRKAEKGWLDYIQNKLPVKMRSLIKTWNISPNAVVVINHNKAIEKGMCLES